MSHSGGASASAIVDLDDSDLQFTSHTTHSFSQQKPDSALDPEDGTDDRARLLDPQGPRGGSRYNFLSLAFYQRYFDVDTADVQARIMSAMIPKPKSSFLRDVLKDHPDLYGPFWICVTLVISVAVTGNLASYLQTTFEGGDFQWHYDFHKITMAATAVFSYAWLVPSGIYGFLWWTSTGGGVASLTFLDLICLYGYSMVIYIPVSVLWLIQSSPVQWTLVLVAAGLSGSVLVMTLWPIFKENASKTAVILLAVVVALHLLLACGFMLYFFHVPGGQSVSQPAVINSTPKAEKQTKDDPEQAAIDAKAEKDGEEAKEKRTPANDPGEPRNDEKSPDSPKPEKPLDQQEAEKARNKAAEPTQGQEAELTRGKAAEQSQDKQNEESPDKAAESVSVDAKSDQDKMTKQKRSFRKPA